MSPNDTSDEEARELARAYRILEIDTTAPAWAIKRQYRRLAKIWHPDKHASDPVARKEAEHRMKLIIGAYQCIRDAPLRSHGAPKPSGPIPPSARSIDLEALKTPTPTREREIAYFVLGCLGVPAVLTLALAVYVLAAEGMDFFPQDLRSGQLLLLPGTVAALLCFFAFWELFGLGDWLVKKLWGE